MNNTRIRNTEHGPKRDILLFTHPFAAIGVTVNAAGVTRGTDGRLRILAGQALQADTALWADRQTECSLCTVAPGGTEVVIGVTQHDIVFRDADDIQNANCILFGFLDEQKMDPDAVVPDDVKEALGTKVQFLYGNVPFTGDNPPEPVDPARLTALTITGLVMQPAFDPEVFEYTGGTAASPTTSCTYTAAAGTTVILRFNNVTVPNGQNVSLIQGLNTFRVECRNSANQLTVYEINIAYTPPTAYLSSLEFDNITIAPTFDPGTMTYSGSTSDPSSVMNFAAESVTAGATATLNGVTLPVSGVGPWTANPTWTPGNNTIIINVTNGTANEAYEVDITSS